MTRTMCETLDDKLSALWRSACNDYAQETGVGIADGNFPKIGGPEDLSRQLDAEKDHFEDFRMKRRPLFYAMQMVLAPFEKWGDLIAGAASAAFPPASSIMGAMMLLIRGARKVSESFDMITDLFHKLGHFAQRLDSYKGVPLSEGIKTIIVKVLVNCLRVCAASQKLLSRGSLRARFTKWAKNILVEDTSISFLFSELEELTSQEHKMVSAHGLDLTHQALKNTAELLERDDSKNGRERLDRLKRALDPVSASGRVFSTINETRIPGSGSWVEDMIQSWWREPQPLLWIHGGPGVGKTYLASKIIGDLATAEPSAPSAPIVASFFFKNNDVDLRSFNKALRTLAWQMVLQRPSFAAHAEEFCLKEDPANSYVVWRKLLLDYFAESPPDARTCFVIDGIDEADPEEQEILFSLLERTYSTYLTEDEMSPTIPFRVVLLSRDSVGGILDEHSLGLAPEIGITNNQNKDDLHKYVSQKLQKTKLFRGSPDFQDEVIRDICGQAEGLWEWANLVIKSVLRCRTKEQIRRVVRTMPRGISAMLHAELQRLARELSASDALSNELPDELSDGEGSTGEATATRIQQLNILLSFVTRAQKPLTLEQLDIILQVVLEEEVLNLEDDLRTVYSSLFSLRPAEDEEYDNNAVIVTLRHSSFYEFFSTSVAAGPIYVDPDEAEAFFVFVLLYALHNTGPPKREEWVWKLKNYAHKFLPLHLSRANPEKAASRRGKISRMLADLFIEEPIFKYQHQHWLIERFRMAHAARYIFHPSSGASEISRYWWDTEERETANQRAELVLNWLAPDAKQLLQNCARSSTVASDACPFTVLFSRLAESFSRLWLIAKDIEEDDGLPKILSSMLFVYTQMAGTEGHTSCDEDIEGSSSEGKTAAVSRNLESPKILLAAEMQGLEKTPMWHARLAQALLLHYNNWEALDHFQIALDENDKHSILSKQALSIIHRDMARACTDIGRHKEALAHSDLAESLHEVSMDSGSLDHIAKLLNTAQMEQFAKMTDKAVATADEAWKAFKAFMEQAFIEQNRYYPDRFTLSAFFSIFLELHQTHRVRPVFDFAFSQWQKMGWNEDESKRFVDFLAWSVQSEARVMRRVLHFVLMPDDGKYVDFVASIAGRLKASRFSSAREADVKYLLASVMFENGMISAAIQAYYEAASHDNPKGYVHVEEARIRARSRLATVCLRHPESPFCEETPLILDDKDEYGDICLVLSSWLRDRGDITNAREVIRGRLKRCIEILSDDEPFNDDAAFISLFNTFLVAADSDEDLTGALYLIKHWRRDTLQRATADDPISEPQVVSEDTNVSESLDQVHLADDKEREPDGEVDDRFWYPFDPLTECSNCKREVKSIYHWYFCRTCPFTALCRRCYSDAQAAISQSDAVTQPRGICNPQHEFYYTGARLRASEYVPEGMMALESSEGNRQMIWIEEWKDRLSERWGTANFAFEGGLSSWCMRVLPEPQRARWATFFKV